MEATEPTLRAERNIFVRPRHSYTASLSKPILPRISEKMFNFLVTEGVMYGSRALDVSKTDSNFDFAICIQDLPADLEAELSRCKKGNPRKYFKVLPPENKLTFIPKIPIQDSMDTVGLIILESEEDLDVVRGAVMDCKKVPKYMLERKRIRIELYQLALKERGWEFYGRTGSNREIGTPFEW